MRANKVTEKVFLRRKHAAEVASISLPVLDRLIRDGRIKVVRVGRVVLISRAALERLAK